MNDKQLVSIVLPVYNRAHVVAAAIRSILDQTYPHFELIVVDDGSTDASAEVIEQFDDERVQYHLVEHGGVSRARNFALGIYRGDCLGFIDSDDVYRPEKIERQVSFLEENPRMMVAYSPYVEIHKGVERYHSCRQQGTDVFFEMFKGAFVNVNSLLIRRECVDDIGGFLEEFTTLEDYDFFLRLAHKYPFGFVDYVSSEYRMSERDDGGDTDRYLHYINYIKSCRDRFERLRDNPKAFNWKYGKVLFGLGKSHFRAGRYEEAVHTIEEALKHRWQPDVWLYLRKCRKKLS